MIDVEAHDHLLSGGPGPGQGHLRPLGLDLPAGQGGQRLLVLSLCGNLLAQEFDNLGIAWSATELKRQRIKKTATHGTGTPANTVVVPVYSSMTKRTLF